jgi:hypothetical protein
MPEGGRVVRSSPPWQKIFKVIEVLGLRVA